MLSALVAATLAQAVLDTEAGTVTLKGRALAGTTLSWRTEADAGQDTCEAADDPCTFAVPKGLPADPSAIELQLDGGVFHPSRVLVRKLLPPDAVVDLQADVSRVPLTHPEAVAGADCTDADCELDGADLVVRKEQGSDDVLDLKLRLRPHVFYAREGAAPDPAPRILPSAAALPGHFRLDARARVA